MKLKLNNDKLFKLNKFGSSTIFLKNYHVPSRFRGSSNLYQPKENTTDPFYIDRKRANAKTHIWNPKNIWKDDILPDGYFPPYPTIPIHQEMDRYPDGLTWSRKSKSLPKLIHNKKYKHPEFDDETVEKYYRRMYDPNVHLDLPEANPVEFKEEKFDYPVYVPEPRYGITIGKFLRIIGRDCYNHKNVFKSWEDLMLMKGIDLKKAGVPLEQRKWILRWVEKYKQGIEPYFISKVKSDARRNKDLKKLIPQRTPKTFKNPYI